MWQAAEGEVYTLKSPKLEDLVLFSPPPYRLKGDCAVFNFIGRLGKESFSGMTEGRELTCKQVYGDRPIRS